MATSSTSPPSADGFAALYVGDLHQDVTEAVLYEAFQVAGKVASCRVCRDSVTRKSLCYGYVNYYSKTDAETAVETLNHANIKGRCVRVMWSNRDDIRRKDLSSNIFVKNLDEKIDNKALHDTFSIFGNILSCKVATDPTGKSKGYGFVHYEAKEAADQAIERVNGMQIGENRVFVGPFLKREELENTDPEHFTNLYVKNLPKLWDEKKLNTRFAEFGEVVSSVIMVNTDGKRFALVNYKESSSAKAAIESLHRQDVREAEDVEAEKEAAGAPEVPEEAEAGKAADAPNAPANATDADKGEVAAPDAPAEATEAAKAEAGEAASAPPEAKDGEAATPTPKEDAAPDAPADGAEEAAAVEPAGEAEAEHPDHLLYVQRAQTRAERREQLLKERGRQRGAKDRPPGVRLCVRNLGEETTSDTLRGLFEPCGKVLSTLAKTEEDGKCRGLGFVVMSTQEEANKAISEMHLKIVDGKPLNVGLAERKRQRGTERGPGNFPAGEDALGGAGVPSGPLLPFGAAGARGKGSGKEGKKGGGRGGKKGGGKGAKAPVATAPGVPAGMIVPPLLPGGLHGAPRPGVPLPYPYGVPPPFGAGLMPGFPPMYPGVPPGALGLRPPLPVGTTPGPPGNLQPLRPPGTYSLPPAMLPGRGTSALLPPPLPATLGGAVPPPVPAPLPGAGGAPLYTPPPLSTQVVGGASAAAPPQRPLHPTVAALLAGGARGPGAPGAGAPAPMPPAALPPLTREVLASMPPQVQKQQLGERLFPLISRRAPGDLAGKITGMMLELNNDEILRLLGSEQALDRKVADAVGVLKRK